jgi:hypothetical protein
MFVETLFQRKAEKQRLGNGGFLYNDEHNSKHPRENGVTSKLLSILPARALHSNMKVLCRCAYLVPSAAHNLCFQPDCKRTVRMLIMKTIRNATTIPTYPEKFCFSVENCRICKEPFPPACTQVLK